MSHFDYKCSLAIAEKDYPFYGIIMAAMRQADSDNIELLRQAWPRVWEELDERYHAPGGLIGDEHIE